MAKRSETIKDLITSFNDNKPDAQVSESPSSQFARTAAFKSMVEQMFIGLVIQGIKDFAPYLVESFTQGFGVKPNPFLSNLTGLIGEKLGNDAIVGSPPIEEIAKACVEQIRQNVELYAGGEIPVDEAMKVVAVFDEHVKKMSGVTTQGQHSYAAAIGTGFMHEVARIQDSAANGASSSGLAIARNLFNESKDDSPDLSEQQQKEEAEARLEAEEAAKAQAEREAEEQRLKLLEEQLLAAEKAEAKRQAQAEREAEEQRLKLLEEQHQKPLIDHQEHSVQLTHSPKPKSDFKYGSFPEDNLNHVAIDVHSSASVNTPLLSAHLTDSVNVTGDTANDSTDSSCCPCCSVM